MRYIKASKINQIVTDLPECIVSKRTLKLLFSEQFKQRSDVWHDKRKNILTASDCAAAIDQNKYQSRKSLILRKAGLTTFKADPAGMTAINHGIKYEDEAADIYMTQNPHLAPFFEVGLIMHPVHPFLGASPDRVTKDGILIEIKVPSFCC